MVLLLEILNKRAEVVKPVKGVKAVREMEDSGKRRRGVLNGTESQGWMIGEMTVDTKRPGRVPNYPSKLMEKVQAAGIRPGLTHVYVEHDGGCAIFRGGTCDCNPEIMLRPEDATH